jgi:hypothetical protein
MSAEKRVTMGPPIDGLRMHPEPHSRAGLRYRQAALLRAITPGRRKITRASSIHQRRRFSAHHRTHCKMGAAFAESIATQPSNTEFINFVREKFDQTAKEKEAPALVHITRHPAVCSRHRRVLPRRAKRVCAI